jgi:hypothetical protein
VRPMPENGSGGEEVLHVADELARDLGWQF